MQVWEQALPPLAARTGVLAYFAKLAPSLHRRKLTMVHDARFRLSLGSYPLKGTTLATAGRDTTVAVHSGADHILETPSDPRTSAARGLTSGGYALLFGSGAVQKRGDAFEAFSRESPAGVSRR